MHVRVATVHFQLDKLQQGISLYRESLVPAAKAQKGFQGAYLMTDASSGKAVNITVWESEADMTASESGGVTTTSKWPYLPVYSSGPRTSTIMN